jgi:hypothetical protein
MYSEVGNQKGGLMPLDVSSALNPSNNFLGSHMQHTSGRGRPSRRVRQPWSSYSPAASDGRTRGVADLHREIARLLRPEQRRVALRRNSVVSTCGARAGLRRTGTRRSGLVLVLGG